MQGANYSLNQGLNYKTFKTARVKTENGHLLSLNDIVLKTLFIFFFFKPETVFSSKTEKRCSSNRRPLAKVIGALMVVDPQHAARY
jgi:hypothetical protein